MITDLCKAIFEDDCISICLPGIPKAKARPRFASKKGFKRAKAFDPQYEEKQTASWQLRARMGSREPLDGALEVMALFFMKKPKSRNYGDYHVTKPDLDNLVKWVGDIGNKILWTDDSQIASIKCLKLYGEEPKTILTVRKI